MLLLLLPLVLLQGCHARACESQKQGCDENVVESKTAEASSIDRDDERLKKDEIGHSDECFRWVCMGLF